MALWVEAGRAEVSSGVVRSEAVPQLGCPSRLGGLTDPMMTLSAPSGVTRMAGANCEER